MRQEWGWEFWDLQEGQEFLSISYRICLRQKIVSGKISRRVAFLPGCKQTKLCVFNKLRLA
jgi:hypothetical protein